MKMLAFAVSAFSLIILFWAVVLICSVSNPEPVNNLGLVSTRSVLDIFVSFAPFFAVLATFVVGMIAASIAREQKRLAANKLKLELFDRRYKVYESIKEFVYAATHNQNFPDEAVFKFKAGTADVGFLFGPEVRAYRDEVRRRVMDVRKTHIIINQKGGYEIQQSKRDMLYDEIDWIGNQITESETVFLPYLKFDDVRAFPTKGRAK